MKSVVGKITSNKVLSSFYMVLTAPTDIPVAEKGEKVHEYKYRKPFYKKEGSITILPGNLVYR